VVTIDARHDIRSSTTGSPGIWAGLIGCMPPVVVSCEEYGIDPTGGLSVTRGLRWASETGGPGWLPRTPMRRLVLCSPVPFGNTLKASTCGRSMFTKPAKDARLSLTLFAVPQEESH